jgi:hypothetical protein
MGHRILNRERLNREEKVNDNAIMIGVSLLILSGILFLVSNSFKNKNQIQNLEQELKDCELSENYERCAVIKRMLDNLKF